MENPIKYQVQPWTFLIAPINHNEMRDENKKQHQKKECKRRSKWNEKKMEGKKTSK